MTLKIAAFLAAWTTIALTFAQAQTLPGKPDTPKSDTTKLLKEVKISTRKPALVHKVDRTIVNADALLSAAGGTALDVLGQSPGVIVEQDANISLQGKAGVTIYINDKPTYLSGTALESYLRSITAASIDVVELMSNPPARYDAAGGGGIINIRLKRNKTPGFNGSVNLGYSQGIYGKTNNGLNFDFRQDKLNVFGNFSYNTANGFNDLDLERHFSGQEGQPTGDFLQNSFIRRRNSNYNGRLGADYYLSEKSTLGVGINGLLNPGSENVHNVSNVFAPQGVLDSSIVAWNNEKLCFRNGSANLNYRHRFDKEGTELTADADYVRYEDRNRQRFDNTGYLPDGSISSRDLLRGSLFSGIDIYSLKTDFSKVLSKTLKYSAGLKTSITTTDNSADYDITVSGITRPDYDKTNHFLYREQISAGYLNADKDFGRISMQAGLRFEHTSSRGHQLGNALRSDSLFSRSYASLFPTFFLQYKLDSAGGSSLNFGYSKRVDRPYYQDLNPFVAPLDKFTFYTGNPFLKASYNHNLELAYRWKHFNASLNYSYQTAGIRETIEIRDGIYYSRPGNLDKQVSKGIFTNTNIDLAKWLNFQFYANAVQIHTISDFYNGRLDNKGTYFFVRPVFQFRLPKDWTLQAEGGYQSRVTSAQFVSTRRGKVTASVSRKFSASTSASLVVNDIFYTFAGGGDINNLAGTRASYRNLSDTRTAVISLSYRFGKAITGLRKHEANGAESEKDRVKN